MLIQEKSIRVLFLLLLVLFLTPVPNWGQSLNVSLSGTVTDPSGGVVPDAQLTLTSTTTGSQVKSMTGPDGLFTFQNLSADAYDLKVSAGGFRDFLQRGIVIRVNEKLRLDVKLELGTAEQAIEVSANASPLNFDSVRCVSCWSIALTTPKSNRVSPRRASNSSPCSSVEAFARRPRL